MGPEWFRTGRHKVRKRWIWFGREQVYLEWASYDNRVPGGGYQPMYIVRTRWVRITPEEYGQYQQWDGIKDPIPVGAIIKPRDNINQYYPSGRVVQVGTTVHPPEGNVEKCPWLRKDCVWVDFGDEKLTVVMVHQLKQTPHGIVLILPYFSISRTTGKVPWST